jgi:FtsP/CotA-like multicopper oxidase with cupredoxin domain
VYRSITTTSYQSCLLAAYKIKMLLPMAFGVLISQVKAETVFSRLSPQYRFAFQTTLPIPQIKKPSASYTNPQNQIPIDFYEIESQPFTHKFFPDLPGASNLLGYDGTFPGPTIRVQKGRQTVIRVVNKGQDQMNLHLHGSYSMHYSISTSNSLTNVLRSLRI